MPRIVAGTCPAHLASPTGWPSRTTSGETDGAARASDVHDAAYAAGRGDDATLDALCAYMRTTRLNINVRQVVSETRNFDTVRKSVRDARDSEPAGGERRTHPVGRDAGGAGGGPGRSSRDSRSDVGSRAPPYDAAP